MFMNWMLGSTNILQAYSWQIDDKKSEVGNQYRTEVTTVLKSSINVSKWRNVETAGKQPIVVYTLFYLQVIINYKKKRRMIYFSGIEELNLLAPFRRPSLELSNAAFVINLKAEVNAPDAAKPARKDCNNKIEWQLNSYLQ